MKKETIFIIILIILGTTFGFFAAELAVSYNNLYWVIAAIISVCFFILALKKWSYYPSFRKFLFLDPLLPPDPISNDEQLTDEQKKFINSSSYGGVLGTWYFLFNHMPKQSLEVFIPLWGGLQVGRIMAHGRRIVWDAKVWPDFGSFRKRQRILDTIGLIAFVFGLGLLVVLIILGFTLFFTGRLER